jgi:hypothetical protein
MIEQWEFGIEFVCDCGNRIDWMNLPFRDLPRWSIEISSAGNRVLCPNCLSNEEKNDTRSE